MKVYEIKIKVFLLCDIRKEYAMETICNLIDESMSQNEQMLAYHQGQGIKAYSFDSFYPVEQSSVYQREKIYTFRIRTVNPDLAQFFSATVPKQATKSIKALISEQRIIPQNPIDKVFTLTPAVVQTDSYWRQHLNQHEFETLLTNNLRSKYRLLMGEEFEDDAVFYQHCHFLNRIPIATPYKDISILGDKLEIYIPNDQKMQHLWYLTLGTGLLQKNSRGFGFLGYRYHGGRRVNLC